MSRSLSLRTPQGTLAAQLVLPFEPRAVALLAQLQPNPTDAVIAANLAARHYGILSLPLLTGRESHFPDTHHNVALLTQRLLLGLDLLHRDGETEGLPVVLYATGHGTPAAIRAAAQRDSQVRVVACHGGLIDLAGLQYLNLLGAPLLVLVDRDDPVSATAYRRAEKHLTPAHQMIAIEPLENPSSRVASWFSQHLGGA